MPTLEEMIADAHAGIDRVVRSFSVATATGEDLDRLAEVTAAPGAPYRRIFGADGADAPAEVYIGFLHSGVVPDGYRLETDAELRIRVRAGWAEAVRDVG